MQELVGRFFSFEEHLGRGLVRLLFYVLVFLLIVTTAWELVVTLSHLTKMFWTNLWRLLVIVPFTFLVKLLMLRLGAEVILAVLSIDDSLRSGSSDGDVMSSGLSMGGDVPMPPPPPASPPRAPVADVVVSPHEEPEAESSGPETKPEE